MLGALLAHTGNVQPGVRPLTPIPASPVQQTERLFQAWTRRLAVITPNSWGFRIGTLLACVARRDGTGRLFTFLKIFRSGCCRRV
jgi:hypothetical protein